jgi:hypothetical protein
MWESMGLKGFEWVGDQSCIVEFSFQEKFFGFSLELYLCNLIQFGHLVSFVKSMFDMVVYEVILGPMFVASAVSIASTLRKYKEKE